MNKFKKKWLAVLMILTILVSTVTPVWAEEAPTIDVSTWAISKLNEGEKYGIYPIEWYYDQFKGPISEERLDQLVQSVDEKLGLVAEKVEFTPVTESGKNTRGDVIVKLYNVLGSYNLITPGEVVSFMQKSGIVNGSLTGLNLDKVCNSEQAVVFAINTVQAAYDKLDAGGKGVFWKVEKGGNTVYLLGSIHIGSTDLYPLNEMVTEAFESSDALYVEADLLNSQEGMAYFQSKAFYTDGTTIKDHISATLYTDLLIVFEKYALDPAIYGTLKPWSLANQLSVVSMADSGSTDQGASGVNLGVDVYFTVNSYLDNKPVVELEGIPYQTDMFDGLSKEYQEKYLGAVLAGILAPAEGDSTESAKQINEWLEYWNAGDLAKFKESFSAVTEGESDEMTQMLFGKRDVDMTDKIQTLLDAEGSATYFVVVGAGHYINKGSVVDLLTERGYTVKWLY